MSSSTDMLLSIFLNQIFFAHFIDGYPVLEADFMEKFPASENHIVFATDVPTEMALREVLKNGFSCAMTTNANGETVYALYDAISFSYPYK